MPSDAHELAARLHDFGAGITDRRYAFVLTAAAELVRLADENERLLEELESHACECLHSVSAGPHE